MSRDGKHEDFTGRKLGLVTVSHRQPGCHVDGAVRWYAVCECGAGKWYRSNNLKRWPPRTHRNCAAALERMKVFK